MTDLTESISRNEAALASFVNHVALGRPAEPDDIAPGRAVRRARDADYVSLEKELKKLKRKSPAHADALLKMRERLYLRARYAAYCVFYSRY